MTNKWILLCSFMLLFFSMKAVELKSAGRDPKYVETIIGRSQKIVDVLKIKNDSVKTQVLNIISNRYFQLNDIYSKRDSLINDIKASDLSSEDKKIKTEAAQNEKDAALYKTHFAFPASLSLYLNEKQIDAVKDGMTFGVLMVTYNSHLDMIPSLKKEEKAQIFAWLLEARELALDAESSNKKHEVFGKYKGRINNYLTARGYDLKKEREEWYKRIEKKKKKEKK
jgi:hypothetical protein